MRLGHAIAYSALGVNRRGLLAVVFDNMLTPTECQECIQKSERLGYEPALVNLGGGRQKLITDVRNSDRCIIDDSQFANLVWGRLQQRADTILEADPDMYHDLALDKMFTQQPSDGKVWKAYGLNERFRYLKYTDGHYFKPHRDGSYKHKDTAKSFATVMLYLNDIQEGSGYTSLYNDDPGEHEMQEFHVQPKAGSVLVFQHNVKHAGAPVLPGDTKYAIRTDIMFTSETLSCAATPRN